MIGSPPILQGFCDVDDKFFITEPMSDSSIQQMTNKIVLQVLSYFGIQQLSECSCFVFSNIQRKFFNLRKANTFCPFKQCPSVNMGWVNKYFVNPERIFDGIQIDSGLLREKMGLLFSTGYVEILMTYFFISLFLQII